MDAAVEGSGRVSSLRFAAAVRQLGIAARRQQLVPPGFRSPPRVAGADRTVRWRADGSAVVAVRLRGRPWPAVVGDMIEGVLVANGVTGTAADRTRTALWSAMEATTAAAA